MEDSMDNVIKTEIENSQTNSSSSTALKHEPIDEASDKISVSGKSVGNSSIATTCGDSEADTKNAFEAVQEAISLEAIKEEGDGEHSHGEVSDEKLTQIISKYLEGKDLTEVKLGKVRAHVDEKLGFEIDKKRVKKVVTKVVEEMNENQASSEDEESEEDEDEENPSKKSKKGGGFNKLQVLSAELAEFIGQDQMSRPQVVKAIWDYIKEHGLQDPKDKRQIVCDDKLKTIFKVNRVSMFKMNKILSKHIKAADSVTNATFQVEDSPSSSDDERASKKRRSTASAKAGSAKKTKKSSNKAKSDKPKTGGFNKECELSETLQAFVGAPRMSRPQVVKHIWDHIKEHELQNPADKREIICDATLQEIFGEEKVTMFSLNKYLKKHINPTN